MNFNGGQLTELNIIYFRLSKKDQLCDKDDLYKKVAFLYKRLLKCLFSDQPALLNAQTIRTLPFNYDRYEYDYPSDEFVRSCLRKSHLRRSFKRIQSQLLIIREIISIEEGPKRKRQIYYRLNDRFEDQAELDQALNEILFQLKISRFHTIISASPKGLIRGPIVILTQEMSLVDLGAATGQFSGLNLDFKVFEFGPFSGKFVLVVEKETVFFELLANQLCSNFPLGSCLLITGRGYPDYLTRRFLKDFQNHFPDCPVFYIGDFDPFGIDILVNYLFGSPISVFENTSLPTILPLIPETSLFRTGVPLEAEDMNKIESLLKSPPLDLDRNQSKISFFHFHMKHKMTLLRTLLGHMKTENVKYEIESLISKSNRLGDIVWSTLNNSYPSIFECG